MNIKILLADDHQLFLDALEMIISIEDNLDVIGKVENGIDLLAFLQNKDTEEPDIIVLDINMPEMDGIKALDKIAELSINSRIIMLSSMSDTRLVHEALKKGAQGFLCKKCARKEIIQAIHAVNKGESYFGETINKQILQTLLPGKKKTLEDDPYMINQLTDREIDVLKLIALEYTSKEIAEQLFIAQSTVDTHRKNLIEKLKVKNSVGLGKVAVLNGMI